MTHRKLEVVPAENDNSVKKWHVKLDGIILWTEEDFFTAKMMMIYFASLEMSLRERQPPFWYKMNNIFHDEMKNIQQKDKQKVCDFLLERLPSIIKSIISDHNIKITKQTQQKK